MNFSKPLSNVKQGGFSLLEIMVAIAILAVLASIAIPYYQQYLQEAEKTAVYESYHEAKKAVELFVVTHKRLPTSPQEAGLAEAASSLFEIQWINNPLIPETSGAMKGNNGMGNKLLITASLAKNGELQWRCISDNGNVYNEFLPPECQNPPASVKVSAVSNSNAGLSCSTGEEQVTVFGQHACVKTCGPGTHRNPQDALTCQCPHGLEIDAQGKCHSESVLQSPCKADEDHIVIANVQSCVKKCPQGEKRDTSNPFNCLVDSQSVQQSICRSDEDNIVIANVQSCVKKCPQGKKRDTSNLFNCVDDNALTAKQPEMEVPLSKSVTEPLEPVAETIDLTIDTKDIVNCPTGQVFNSVLNLCQVASNTNPCPAGFKAAAENQAFSLRQDKLRDILPQPQIDELEKTAEGQAKLDQTVTYLSQSKPLSCHLCRGPKFICERSHRSQSCEASPGSSPDNPFVGCINDVENLIDGSRYVTRRCATIKDLEKDWISETADRNECRHYNVHDLQDAHFSCSMGCIGDNCNIETVPKSRPDSGDLKFTISPVSQPLIKDSKIKCVL